MRPLQYSHRIALFVAGVLCAQSGIASARPAVLTAERHAPRIVESVRIPLPKYGAAQFVGSLTSTVAVKFADGCDAHVAAGKLEIASGFPTAEAAAAIARAAVPGSVRATFDGEPESLRAKKRALEASSGSALPDLSLYVDVQTASPEAALRLATELESLDEVETAYVRPVMGPELPLASTSRAAGKADAVDATPSTPDYSFLQHYLNAAPDGNGIKPVRAKLGPSGGRGAGVHIVDIEYSWTTIHEDLPFDPAKPETYRELHPDLRGHDYNPKDQGNHGTAVLGILVGMDNGYGVTGMCPDAEMGIINPIEEGTKNYRIGPAIMTAMANLTPGSGDIILIEQQAPAINAAVSALPIEFLADAYAAIQTAAAAGFIVVEPAGNGSSSLDSSKHAIPKDRFNRYIHDSGAIMVGAGNYGVDDRTRYVTSNWGRRIDVQGQGEYVASTGTGDLRGDLGRNADRSVRYTNNFYGTSSASACVAGAAAVVQGAIKDTGDAPLSPAVMRALLTGTGSRDYTNSAIKKPIGTRPNVALALDSFFANSPFVSTVRYVPTISGSPEKLVIEGLEFTPGVSYIEVQQPGGERIALATTSPEIGRNGRPDGTTTRLEASGSAMSAAVPPGTAVLVSVVTPGAEPGTETRSAAVFFKR